MKTISYGLHGIVCSLIVLLTLPFQAYGQQTDQQVSGESESVGAVSPWGFGGFPIIFYSEETRWAFGAGGQLFHKLPDDPFASTLGLGLYYSMNKQYNISTGGDVYLSERDHRIGVELARVYWPDIYYGIGNNAQLSDEEKFTSSVSHLKLAYQYRVVSDLYAGLQYYYNNTGFSDLQPNGTLANGTVIGSNGGGLAVMGLVLTWDSRDENVYPTKGSYHQLQTFHGGSLLGNPYAYSVVSLDLRHYMSFPGEHILALRAVTELASGQRPFYQMSRLGDALRGYFQPRYRDRDLIAMQGEYRMPVYWQFGAVVFAGFGQVAPGIDGFALRELRPSLGFGIRFALIPEQKVNLRIDMGFGRGDSSMDINILETF